MIRIVRNILLGAVFSACSIQAKGYSGETLPKENLAVIKGYGVTIHKVNDIEVGTSAHSVAVPAGSSTVFFTINASNYHQPGDMQQLRTLTGTFEPGKEYVITGQRGDGRICAWLVSSVSGQADFEKSAGCLK